MHSHLGKHTPRLYLHSALYSFDLHILRLRPSHGETVVVGVIVFSGGEDGGGLRGSHPLLLENVHVSLNGFDLHAFLLNPSHCITEGAGVGVCVGTNEGMIGPSRYASRTPRGCCSVFLRSSQSKHTCMVGSASTRPSSCESR